jgi:predicted AAA+ superfamily ATPase
MIRKEDLRTIIKEQHEQLQGEKDTVPRKSFNTPDLSGSQAIVITGVRRSGKSTFLHQLMQKAGVFYFLTFEDIRLTGFEVEDFIKVEEVFKEEYGEKEFFFFDEIQNIPGWELYVRQKLDMRKHVALTGSNARLLSRELGTHLTGRHLDYEIFPFSYSEYLNYTKSTPSLNSFQEYFTNGGFPEFLKQKRTEYLQHLLEDILIRDIAVRHGIRNIRILKEMVVYLLSNLGKEFSFQMLRRTFDLGATSTVIDYISFLEDSYLLFTIPKFDYSLKKQSYNPKKVYAVDNGMAIVNSLSFSGDYGRMLENLVFITLRRKTKEIFYFKGKKECDFVIKERGSITAVIQVCYQINGDNKSREIDGLTEAVRFFGLDKGLLLTMNEEDLLKVDGLTIRLLPVWKWIG